MANGLQAKSMEPEHSMQLDILYSGTWKNSKRHGRGRLSKANGDVIEGTWRDGKDESVSVEKSKKSFDDYLGEYISLYTPVLNLLSVYF